MKNELDNLKEKLIDEIQSLYDTDGMTDEDGDPVVYLQDVVSIFENLI